MPKSNERSTGVSVGLTRNLGNYNTARFDAWENTPLDDDDDAEEVRNTLFERLKDELREQVKQLD